MSETSRGKNLFVGILFGLLVVGGAFGLGYALKRQQIVQEPNKFGGGVDFNSYSSLRTSTYKNATPVGALVLDNFSGRTYALFVNDSANAIYLNLSNTSTVANNYTILLNGKGSFYEILPENMYTGPVYASSTATSSLTVTER